MVVSSCRDAPPRPWRSSTRRWRAALTRAPNESSASAEVEISKLAANSDAGVSASASRVPGAGRWVGRSGPPGMTGWANGEPECHSDERGLADESSLFATATGAARVVETVEREELCVVSNCTSCGALRF